LAIEALGPYEELIDANSLGQTPARPRRSPTIKLRQYLKLIEIEERLWKLLETMERPEPRKSEQTLTAEEAEAVVRALAEVRHGLPKRSLSQEQTYRSVRRAWSSDCSKRKNADRGGTRICTSRLTGYVWTYSLPSKSHPRFGR
jgi:hypothetical protein